MYKEKAFLKRLFLLRLYFIEQLQFNPAVFSFSCCCFIICDRVSEPCPLVFILDCINSFADNICSRQILHV